MAQYDGRVEELAEEIRRLEHELEIAKQERKIRELRGEIAREKSIPWKPPGHWWPHDGWTYPVWWR